MLAISSGLTQFLILAGATVIATAILGIGRAVMGLVRTRQTKQREDEFDQRTLAEFFFDTARDPRTGAPAKEGWTTKVDRTLSELARNQEQTSKLVRKILYELQPNGGGNFRAVVEKTVQERNELQDGGA